MDKEAGEADGAAMRIVEALADELADRGIERQELARVMGVDPAAITRLFAGSRRLKVDELARVEDEWGLMRGHFFRRVDLVRDAVIVRDAIANDGNLTKGDREVVCDAYDSALRRSAEARAARRSRR